MRNRVVRPEAGSGGGRREPVVHGVVPAGTCPIERRSLFTQCRQSTRQPGQRATEDEQHGEDKGVSDAGATGQRSQNARLLTPLSDPARYRLRGGVHPPSSSHNVTLSLTSSRFWIDYIVDGIAEMVALVIL